MTEVDAFYQEQAKKGLSSHPLVAALQKQALADFAVSGFPTRVDEEWKYTAITPFLEKTFVKTRKNDNPINLPSLWQDPIWIHNGTITIPKLALPEGVIVMPLAQAFVEYADLIQKYWQNASKMQGFHALNMAFLDTGIFIYVPKGVQLQTPLCIEHYQDVDEGAHYLRHIVIAEAKSELTLIEDYHGASESSYFTNTMTDLCLQAEAKLTHLKIQRESKSAFHVALIQAKQNASSQFNSHSVSLGGKLVRSDLDIHFLGERAECLMNGIYVPGEGQHIDHHTQVLHAVPHCTSRQNYKGILTGHSHAVFNGKVIVAKDAQHTTASQQNKNLLLARHAEIDTKPQLEIFADEVTCTHGATVGQLDEEALFYLATRGLGRKEATSFLTHAFAAENLEDLPLAQVTEWISSLIDEQLRFS